MAACVNKVILVGYLGKDPEQRFTQSGRPVTSFTLATSETWKVGDGEREQRTEWFNVVVWNRLAEVCKTYLYLSRAVAPSSKAVASFRA